MIFNLFCSVTINGHADDDGDGDGGSDDKSQTIIFYILRLLVNIFFQKVPSLSTNPASMRTFRPPQGSTT